MLLKNSTADIYIPDETPLEIALNRTTHLGIGAHQDDLEVFAFHGILECFEQGDKWFTGVTVTNGSGSARSGTYSNYSDEEMMEARRLEQRMAADIGKYAAQFQLGYKSSKIKSQDDENPVTDLVSILQATQPHTIYLHNPADKHETHIATLTKCLEALRQLPKDDRPTRAFGCEVWRDLDWLPDEEKVCLNVSRKERLATALLEAFDTQISGGKRYDLATLGRRRANATFFDSHEIDQMESVIFAMDLSPLLQSDELSLESFLEEKLKRFREDVISTAKRFEE